MEFYTAVRKKELIPYAMAWMELESIMLSEIRFYILRKKRKLLSLSLLPFPSKNVSGEDK